MFDRLERGDREWNADRQREDVNERDRASVPGRATSAAASRPAPIAIARSAVRAAHGTADRIVQLGDALSGHLARNDYGAAGFSSFEIRSALQRATRGLDEVERFYPVAARDLAEELAAARARLAAQARDLAAAILQAPELERYGAGEEPAEHTWCATRGSGGAIWDADVASIAPALGLGEVSVRSDDTSRAITDSDSAHGVAIAGVVHLHPDRVRPGTPEGREVLAHELVHLAQARLPVERDAGRPAAEHEAADIAGAIARGGGARTPQHHIDLSRPAADRHAADPAPDPSAGTKYLSVRIDDIVDRAVEHIPYEPGTTDGLVLDGPEFAHYLQGRIRTYVADHGYRALCALLADVDLEMLVAGLSPLYRRDVMNAAALDKVGLLVGAELAREVCEAFARVAPRLVTAARAAGSAAWLTSADVACDGHLDVLVRDALLRPRLANVEVARAEQRRADRERAKTKRRAARAAKMSGAALSKLLDATAARMEQAAAEVTPWHVYIGEGTRDWIDHERYWITAESDEKLAELGPLIDAGAETVQKATDGIKKIVTAYSVPPDGPDTATAEPVRQVLRLYCDAIESAHGTGDAADFLKRADQAAAMVALDLVSLSLRENRAAAADVANSASTASARTPRLANARQYAADARSTENDLEREIRNQRQRVVAGQTIELETAAEIATEAGERAIASRLEAIIVRSSSLLLEATQTNARDAASRITSFIGGPVHRIEQKYNLAHADAALWFAGQPQSAEAREEFRVRRQRCVDDASAALAKLKEGGKLEIQFERALQEIRDEKIRQIIYDLAALLAISIVTAQAGQAIGAAARAVYLARAAEGALLVERAAGVVGATTAFVADSTLTTAAMHAVGGDSSGFGSDLVWNAVTLAALKPFEALGAEIDAAENEATWVERGKRWVLKGAVGSFDMISRTATAFALGRLRAAGGASAEQQADWLEEAASIALGHLISERLTGLSARLHELGDDAGRAIGRRLSRAKRVAEYASEHGSPTTAMRAVEAYSQLLRLEGQLQRERAQAGKAVAPEKVAAHRADSAELAPERLAMLRWRARGLEVLASDGSLWMGSKSQIEAAVTEAGSTAAAAAIHEPDGRVRIRIAEQDVVLVPRGLGAPNPGATFDVSRGQLAGNTKTADEQRIRELKSNVIEFYRDMRDSIADELGVPRAQVRVTDGHRLKVEHAPDGEIVVTYKPGIAPAKAIETWKHQAKRAKVQATSVGNEVDTTWLSDGAEDVARWQSHGIEGEPAAAGLVADAEFRTAYGRWMSQPERVDAAGKIVLPDGVSPQIAAKLQAVVDKGNVVQTTKALAVTERLAEKFPDLDLDPSSAGWKQHRAELVAEMGEEAVKRYEVERGGTREANEQKAIDQRLDEAIGNDAISELRGLVPDAEVYVTGAAPRNDKDPTLADLDVIVVVPPSTPHKVRCELEDSLRARTIAIRTTRNQIAVPLDPKVMTPAQFAGWSMSAPSRGINERVDGIGGVVGGRAADSDLHNHVMGIADTEYFIQRVGGGNAVATLHRAWELASDPALGKDGSEAVQPTVKRILETAVGDVERAQRDGSPAQLLETRARRALDDVLSATDRVPFDHTYDLRDHFVSAAGGIGAETFITDMLVQQSEAGVQYSEQSVSMGKLDRMFDPATMAKARDAAAEAGHTADLRFLAMLRTDQVLSGDGGDVGGTLGKLKTYLLRKDVAGVDIAGPEMSFSAEGMENFEKVYRLVESVASERGRPLVLRPHVGEGYNPVGTGDHAKIARQNLERLITTLERIGYQAGGNVVVRLGHAAHATPGQLERLSALGVIVESNVGSNLATGAIARAADHPILYQAYLGVRTVLATDGEGVMGTNVQAEHRRAAMMFAEFRAGRIGLEVDGEVVHYADITDATIRERFSIEWIDQQSQDYRDDVAAGDARDKGK